MSFNRFLTYARNVATLTGRDVVEIMDTMEPLPLKMSWSHFIDIEQGKLKEVDAGRYDQIRDAHVAILSILDQPNTLRLDYYLKNHIKIEVSPNKIKTGRFIYTKAVETWLREAFNTQPEDWADFEEEEVPQVPGWKPIAETSEVKTISEYYQSLSLFLSKHHVDFVSINSSGSEPVMKVSQKMTPEISDAVSKWLEGKGLRVEYKYGDDEFTVFLEREQYVTVDPIDQTREAIADITQDEDKEQAREEIRNMMTEEEYQTYDGDLDDGLTEKERGDDEESDGVESRIREKTREFVKNTIGKTLEKIVEVESQTPEDESMDEDSNGESNDSFCIREFVKGTIKSMDDDQMARLEEMLGGDSDDEEVEEVVIQVDRKSDWMKANPIMRDDFLEHDWGTEQDLDFAAKLQMSVTENQMYIVSDDKSVPVDEYKKEKGHWPYPEYGVVFTKRDKVFIKKLLDYHDSIAEEVEEVEEEEIVDLDEDDEQTVENLVDKYLQIGWKWFHIKSKTEFEFTDKPVGEARDDSNHITGSQELIDWAVENLEDLAEGNFSIDYDGPIEFKFKKGHFDKLFATPKGMLYDLDTRQYVDKNQLGNDVTGDIVFRWCTKKKQFAKRKEQLRHIFQQEFLKRTT